VSAPPLPDVFGNYALGDFVEVVSPAGVDWWPQTPGWWLAGALVGFLTARAAWRRLRHWYRDRYRREALVRLTAIEGAESNDSELIRQLNTLLKLTAMAASSRDTVASLTGDAWPRYLNGECEAPAFDSVNASLIASGSYRSTPVNPAQRRNLLNAASTWIREHRDHHA